MKKRMNAGLFWPSLLFLLAVNLAACGGESMVGTTPAPDDDQTPAEDVELCVRSECGSVIELAGIPDAENIHFTPEGRLFVTGNSNVYEIVQHDELIFTAQPLSDAACGFTGMAQKDDVLYVVCGDGTLLATPFDDLSQLQPIFQMEGMCIANGTALGPDGNLYIVDEPLNPACLPPEPKIVRLSVDPADPLNITAQETWLPGSALGTLPFGVGTDTRFPNGLTLHENRFYSTDGGSVFFVELLEDGRAGPVTSIFFEPTAHDDLSVAGDTLLVTDFFGGRILQLSFDGELLQETAVGTFDSPSAVQQAMPPMFRADDILVTEKGLLLEENLPIDVLSLFRKND